MRIRYILDVLRPVNRKGSYQGETKRIPTTSKNSDSHIPLTVEVRLEKFGGNKAE